MVSCAYPNSGVKRMYLKVVPMLQVFRATALAPSDVDTSIDDLLLATSRRTILLSGAMYLSWHILTTGGWIAVRAGHVWLVTLVMVLTYSGALWLLPRRLFAAQIVWLAGLTLATTVALVLFRQPEIAFLYALLPFLAVVTLHWRIGLLAEGLIVLLLAWLAQDPSLHLSSVYLLAIACGGLITGLFDWASYSTLMTVAEWSFSSVTQARHYMVMRPPCADCSAPAISVSNTCRSRTRSARGMVS